MKLEQIQKWELVLGGINRKMNAIRKFASYISKYPLETIKHLLILCGFFVAFSNLFDCIIQETSIYEYISYVGVVFLFTILLVVIDSNIYLCFVLALFGIITIFNNTTVGMSGGIVFILFAKRIANNIAFSTLIYFVTIMVVIGNCSFNGVTPPDTINLILVYIVVYLVDYLLYTLDKK